ncbi:MAG: hypothetical protein M3154_09220 [Candidatus Eremiobacteraeota bacterium]|nr:hypothetical protein [Candidatus Eremiobacteraeota bacterium]
MRTRDVYATLRELVPSLVERPGDIVLEWSDRADPVWRRGDRWARVEAVTSMQLLVSGGHGDQTDVRQTHVMTDPLPLVAREVADLLNRPE